MRGVAARYPAFDAALGRPVNLEQRVNLCRTEQQKAEPLAYESRELLALSAYVGKQSRGLPIAVVNDEKTKPFIDAGAYFTRKCPGMPTPRTGMPALSPTATYSTASVIGIPTRRSRTSLRKLLRGS